MRHEAEALRAIAASEFRAALRGRVVQGFAVLFGVLALSVSLAGLAASGQLVVQGYARTAVSLLTLAIYLLPLLGFVIGAHAFGAENGGTELLLAQPVSRTGVLLGRALGLAAALGAVALAGFGLAGVVVGLGAGWAGIGGYCAVSGGALLVGWAALAAGVLIGVLARRRLAAVGTALAAWLVAAVLYDLAAIALLQFTGSGEPGPYLVTLLVLNPIDGMRALGLVSLGADVLLGPTGAAMQRALGPDGGAALVLGALAAWIAIPLWFAGRVYCERDF